MVDIEDVLLELWTDKYWPTIKDIIKYGLTTPYFYLGYKDFEKRHKPVILDKIHNDVIHPLNLTKHVWISGVQGSGKSNKLRRLFINSFVKKGWGGIYIDTHGTADIILQSIPPNRWKDVIYIAPWMGRVYGINSLKRYSNESGEIDRIAEDVVEIFRKQYPRSWGDNLANTIRFATKAVLIAEENNEKYKNPTLLDVYNFLTDTGYRANILGEVNNEIITNFFSNMKKQNASSKLEVPLSADDVLLFLCQANGLDMLECMENRKIIICNLDKDKLSENANLIAGNLISVITQCAAKRKEGFFHPYFAIAMDEFYEYANKHINVLIEQMRKKNVCLLLANQNRDQIPSTVQPAIAMCQTRFIHTISDEDLAWISKIYSKWFSKEDLIGIPFYNCISDIHYSGRARLPKIISTPEFIPDYDRDYANKIKFVSLSFAPNRYELKNKIEERLSKLSILDVQEEEISLTGELIFYE